MFTTHSPRRGSGGPLRANLLLMLILGLLVAACADNVGAGGPTPTVDEQPPESPIEQPTDQPGQPSDQQSPANPPAAEAPTPPADPYDQALDYARCIRDNGYPEWPDPNADGQFMIRRDHGMSFDDPRRQAAMEACQALRPPGMGAGIGPGGAMHLDQEALLEFARCMRANGVPQFPDPGTSGGRVIIGQDSGIDPNDPTFRDALETCRQVLNP
jgi:hypothetical protein